MTSPRALPFNDLPQSFRREQQELVRAGITTWPEVQAIDELQLSRLARSGLASARNLKRLRGIATLDIPPQDAALLMHAGIASISALASCTPERLMRQTGRLERSLGTRRQAVVDLNVARDWIKRAKQLMN
jgi:hypothetical protein